MNLPYALTLTEPTLAQKDCHIRVWKIGISYQLHFKPIQSHDIWHMIYVCPIREWKIRFCYQLRLKPIQSRDIWHMIYVWKKSQSTVTISDTEYTYEKNI